MAAGRHTGVVLKEGRLSSGVLSDSNQPFQVRPLRGRAYPATLQPFVNTDFGDGACGSASWSVFDTHITTGPGTGLAQWVDSIA